MAREKKPVHKVQMTFTFYYGKTKETCTQSTNDRW